MGKGAFPEPEKADSQNLAMEGPRDSVGLAGEGTEFSLMTWAFVFQISSPDFIHREPWTVRILFRNRDFELRGVLAFLVIRGNLCCLSSRSVWR